MTQEDKELLLKDLSARVPYDIKCKIEMWIGYDVCTIYNINSIGFVEIVEDSDTNGVNIERIKPYLFPLSSMTEEQKKYIADRWGVNEDFDFEIDPNWGKYFVELGDVVDYVNWLNENHFDIRGLIPRGLAIDATGKGIY